MFRIPIYTCADPTSGWSKNVSSYADVHYAHTLISIVFEHWGALSNGKLARLESISHDNAFLSYHPYEFEQRTMLARFSMNDTIPWTFQFIQKPVYGEFINVFFLFSIYHKYQIHFKYHVCSRPFKITVSLHSKKRLWVC